MHTATAQRRDAGHRVVQRFADLHCGAVEVHAQRLRHVENGLRRAPEVLALDVRKGGEDVLRAKDCIVTEQRLTRRGAHFACHVGHLFGGQSRGAARRCDDGLGLRHHRIPRTGLFDGTTDKVSDRTERLAS